MAFHQSSSSVEVDESTHTLSAVCLDANGGRCHSSISLNSAISNSDGDFASGGGFAHSARNISYQVLGNNDVIIRASLQRADGSWNDGAEARLSEFITNSNGSLVGI